MSLNYRPTLEPIEVPLDKLYLDPNNPRFMTTDADTVDDTAISTPGKQEETRAKMERDQHKIAELIGSIKANGWQPVDNIFVRRHSTADGYVVLEGNRRVTALRQLRHSEPDEFERIKKAGHSIDPLEVLLVEEAETDEQTRMQITYLLGVRHHGSLQDWSPFARASHMYKRLLQRSGLTDDSFKWSKMVSSGAVEGLRSTLALTKKDKYVEQAMRVYRAMAQLDAHLKTTLGEDRHIHGRYYSLFAEVLLKSSKNALSSYIEQDPDTFTLSDRAVARLMVLCRFELPDPKQRSEKAPISTPPEWRQLRKILEDDDKDKREAMLARVEEEGQKPSDVYAERAAELRKMRWDTWLKEVSQILGTVKVTELEPTEDAKKVAGELDTILRQLTAMEES